MTAPKNQQATAYKGSRGKLPDSAHSVVQDAYGRYRTELVRFAAHNYSLCTAEAEDLIQSAYEKLASNTEVLSIKNPRAFLYKLVNNIALNHFRHANVQQKFARDTKDESADLEISPELNPESITQNRQSLEKISEQILKMPLKRRQILVMNRFEHLSYAEISRKIGITEAAVRKHIKRALQDINLDLLNDQ